MNTSLDIGKAYLALKAGRRVSRAGWNGKGLFLILVPGSSFKVNRAPLLDVLPADSVVEYAAHVDLVNGSEVSTWSPSGSDALAEDWCILE